MKIRATKDGPRRVGDTETVYAWREGDVLDVLPLPEALDLGAQWPAGYEGEVIFVARPAHFDHAAVGGATPIQVLEGEYEKVEEET